MGFAGLGFRVEGEGCLLRHGTYADVFTDSPGLRLALITTLVVGFPMGIMLDTTGGSKLRLLVIRYIV